MNLLLFILIVFLNNAFADDLISSEAKNYFMEGVKAQKAGDFLSADTSYKKVLLVAPNDLQYRKFVFNNMGVIFMNLNREEEAEKMFLACLEIDPDYKPALMNLGFIYEKKKSELEAIKYWLKVLDIDLEKLKPKDFIIQENCSGE